MALRNGYIAIFTTWLLTTGLYAYTRFYETFFGWFSLLEANRWLFDVVAMQTTTYNAVNIMTLFLPVLGLATLNILVLAETVAVSVVIQRHAAQNGYSSANGAWALFGVGGLILYHYTHDELL